MMFRKKVFAVSVVLAVLFLQPFFLFSQGNEKSVLDKKTEALENFQAGNYEKAFELYSSLLKKYPKDGVFHYYAGRSLFHQDIETEKAIQYLDYAAGKAQVPSDVFYYLGMAYRKNYQFRESKTAFNKYNAVAGRNELRELSPSREADMSVNAMSMTLEYNPFEVQASSLFSFSDTAMIRQVRGKGGILNRKPEELFFKGEATEGVHAFLFLPREIQKGDYVYFAALSKLKKKGFDLYRVKKNGGKKWGEAEELTGLNTEFDELLPYFDPVSRDLYFASRGYNSMGGFDVFKSHYDSERDSWGEPVNLGFPVNSPMNEYLAMPGYDLGNLLVITDRQGLDRSMTVYKLKLSEPKRSLASASREELYRIGNLGGIAAIPAITDLIPEKTEDKSKALPRAELNSSTANREKPADPYKENIRLALGYQRAADSLNRVAKATRVKVSTMPDPDDRWAHQREIIEWEKQARDYQAKADEIYARMQEQEKNGQAVLPPAIEKKEEINGITVYNFKEPAAETKTESEPVSVSEKAKEVFRTEDEPGEVVPRATAAEESTSRFIILDKSPYNQNNPIPVDVSLPKGAFYRVQLGVFSSQPAWDHFGGISPLTAETVSGKNLTRYYAGKFSRYQDARNSLDTLKQKGYTDAFIVSWYNGEKMAINRVQEFEARDQEKN